MQMSAFLLNEKLLKRVREVVRGIRRNCRTPKGVAARAVQGFNRLHRTVALFGQQVNTELQELMVY